ncbi:MAG: tetratricopeptide repeat protein [Alphaproteobacteria bacterium]|nr:tetratricopeptide repeat protein [Alphaproteobacteria bacterium]
MTLALALLLSALSPHAFAQEEVEAEETVTGDAPASPAALRSVDADEVSAEGQVSEGRPYPDAVYRGVDALGLDADFIAACYEGTRMVYRREYKKAKGFFSRLDKEHPGYAIQHVGSVLIYQSLMMENFDFRFESQYSYHSSTAITALEAELEAKPDAPRGERALKRFFAGALMGVESIHIMRRGEYVPALSRGLDAIRHIDEVKALAPDFRDPRLGDGLYKYWRSVVTLNSKVLPDFEDQRAEGIEDMKAVESEGVFLGPGATMALAFTWIEERDLPRARKSCLRNYRDFPKNVINNLVLSRVLMYERKYEQSLRVLGEIEAEAPENQRVWYYYATVYLRQNELDRAEAAVDRYLEFEDLDGYFRAQGLHRKGDIAYRRKDFAQAEALYKEALKTGDYKPAKQKLERMRQLKREGRISY